MLRPTTVAALIGAAVLAAACKDAVNPPEQGGLGIPLFSYSANGITKDQVNGATGYQGRKIFKGFNSTNPHVGDAIVATFFWLGSTNIIDSVVDVLTTAPDYTPVGNQYHLVQYVTSGGYSMATYVATNVQNFPDALTDSAGGSILAVGAYLSDSITDGGVSLSAWTGVEDNFTVALGQHRSGTGTGSGVTTVQAGPIAVDADALVFTVTMTGPFNGGPPDGYTSIGVGSDNFIRDDQAYAVQASAGTVNPAWTSFFDGQSRTWLATTFALKRAPPPQPIALDKATGTMGESGTVLGAGFNPQSPHVGDAIVATFYWVGSTNIIDSVTDHLNSTGYPPVGNTYHLVEYVTADGISMATYIATNVQNFADTGRGEIYVVRANLSDSVSGGVLIAAYTGVAPTFAAALGAHQSTTGSGSGTTVADPGSISVGAGALAYSSTLSNGLVGLEGPAGFTSFGTGSDNALKSDAAYAVQGSAGSVDPQWTWFFNSTPRTWLATVFALKP